MTTIILRIIGLLVLLVLALACDAVDVLLRRLAMIRSVITSGITRMVRHLHHPPARWAAS